MAVSQEAVDTASPVGHHISHRDLLGKPSPAGSVASSHVDAIVVPTGRKPAQLVTAIELARKVDTVLVLLCSQWSSHTGAAKLARDAGVDAVAIRVDNVPAGLVPTFETTGLVVGTPFERKTDTSMKRNLGLVLARSAGMERIVFLDDDIAVPNPEDLRTAVGMLDAFDGVGLANGGYPDNSVVCHALRETDGGQDTFIGGGALAVGSAAMSSFFPNIYNEDWFFLLDESRLRPSAITGLAVQRPYDPFANEWRARSEEFGDCLAEGVFALLDKGRDLRDADRAFWAPFLRDRLAMISGIITRVDGIDKEPAEKGRMLAALKAARGRCQLITPQLCVDYLAAWRRDSAAWRKHIDSFRSQPTEPVDDVRRLQKVIAGLGLAHCTEYASSSATDRR
jgi:glycosyltransferase involved in cell wall biosynthesis